MQQQFPLCLIQFRDVLMILLLQTFQVSQAQSRCRLFELEVTYDHLAFKLLLQPALLDQQKVVLFAHLPQGVCALFVMFEPVFKCCRYLSSLDLLILIPEEGLCRLL